MDTCTLSSPQPMRKLELGEVLCKWDVTNGTFLWMGIFVGVYLQNRRGVFGEKASCTVCFINSLEKIADHHFFN